MAHILHNKQFAEILPTLEHCCKEYELDVAQVLVNSVANQTHQNLYCIVPTGKNVRYIKRKATTMLWEQYSLVMPEVQIATLEMFFRMLYKEMYGNTTKKIISESYRLLLFDKVIQHLNEKKILQFYRNNSSEVNSLIVQKLSQIIYGVKSDGLSPDTFAEDLSRTEQTHENYDDSLHKEKLNDTKIIFEAYNESLSETLIDMPDVYNALTIALRTPPKTLSLQHSTIIVSGFSEFKQPEITALAALHNINARIGIYLDFSLQNGPLFGNRHTIQEAFTQLGFSDTIIDEYSESTDDDECEKSTSNGTASITPNAFIRRWLFNVEGEKRHNSIGNTIRILGLKNKREEVETIARYVKHILLYENIEPIQICIATRHAEQYSQIFREVFTVSDIPINISDRFSLDKSPITVALFSILDVITKGYRRTDLHRALHNPYTVILDTDLKQIDAALLNIIAIELRIEGGHTRGGYKGWVQKISTAITRAQNRLHNIISQTNIDNDENAMDIRELENQISRYQSALSMITNIGSVIPDGLQAITIDEFVEYIRKGIFETMGFYNSVDIFYSQVQKQYSSSSVDNGTTAHQRIKVLEMVEQDARAMSAIIELLDEFQSNHLVVYGKRKRAFSHYVDSLKLAVLEGKYQIREKQGYGVTITSLDQTRGIPYSVMILCGMTEPEFPQRYIPEVFLGKQLENSEETHIRSERMQFYQALTNNPTAMTSGKLSLFITYPEYSDDGNEPTIRSSFIEKLEKITTIANEDISLTHSTTLAKLRRYSNENSWQASRLGRWCQPWIDASISADDVFRVVGKQLIYKSAHKGQEFLPQSLATMIKSLPLLLKYPETHSPNNRVRVSELPAALVESFAQYRTQPVSPSRLDLYASCAYRHFAQHQLRLQPRSQPTTGLYASERGILLHKIVYTFYKNILQRRYQESDDLAEFTDFSSGESKKQMTLTSIRLRSEKLDEYKKILDDVAAFEIEKFRFDHHYFRLEVERILGNEILKHKGLIYLWLEREVKHHSSDKTNLYPCLFEYSFKPLPNTQTSPKELTVRGTIDRIEIGTNADGTLSYSVADYKTSLGSTKKLRDIENGESFQIPLYLHATQQELSSTYNINARPAAGLYYIFDTEESHWIQQIPTKPNPDFSLQDLIERSRTFALQAVENMSTGVVNVIPKKDACKYCGMQTVCRIASFNS